MDGRRRGVSGFLPWTAPCGVGSGCFHRHRTTSAYRREKSRLGVASDYNREEPLQSEAEILSPSSYRQERHGDR